MRNCRSRCCVIGFYFFHGKKKSHWRKREGLPWEWIGGGECSPPFAEGETLKREMIIPCSFFCLNTINA